MVLSTAIILAAALAAGSAIAGGGVSAAKAAAARRIQRRYYDEASRDNEQWYQRRFNEDITQRTDAQNALRSAREYADARIRQASGASAVGGATAESAALAKQQADNVVSGVTTDIAAQASKRKDAIDSNYQATKQQIKAGRAGSEVAYNQGVSQSVADASTQVGEVALNLGLAGATAGSSATTGGATAADSAATTGGPDMGKSFGADASEGFRARLKARTATPKVGWGNKLTQQFNQRWGYAG